MLYVKSAAPCAPPGRGKISPRIACQRAICGVRVAQKRAVRESLAVANCSLDSAEGVMGKSITELRQDWLGRRLPYMFVHGISTGHDNHTLLQEPAGVQQACFRHEYCAFVRAECARLVHSWPSNKYAQLLEIEVLRVMFTASSSALQILAI
jgi:hypothetical protein